MYSNYWQSDWSTLLPLAEFTYNNTPSATTGMTPFFTNKAYHPNIMVHAECKLASTCMQEFVLNLDMLHCQLQENIVNTQCMAPPDFPLGSEAYVCMEFFRITCPSKKLFDQTSGPFKVITQPGSHSYTLCLPNSMCLVHLVFHVLMLEPHTPNTIPSHVQLLPLPKTIGSEEHFEINAICDSAII